MSHYYYHLCCRHRGKHVRITDQKGYRYEGRIVDIDERHVWLETRGTLTADFGGFGYGFYPSYKWGGYGPGRFVPVALAAIGGFALASAFFWW